MTRCLRATLGGALAGDDVAGALYKLMSVLPSVILTPNLSEAAALLDAPVSTRDGMAAAAEALLRRGMRAVLLKGGHLDGDPVDVLASRDGTETLSDTRIAGRMRGTGCTLAIALACELARGAGCDTRSWKRGHTCAHKSPRAKRLVQAHRGSKKCCCILSFASATGNLGRRDRATRSRAQRFEHVVRVASNSCDARESDPARR